MIQQESDFKPPYDLTNADIHLVYEEDIGPGRQEAQGFIVEDPEIALFLQDIYQLATPSRSIIELREQFNTDFAAHHRSDYANVSYDNRLGRFCIETVTF